MEDKRKDLMIAGLYLGDVTLVLAALAKEMPSYVEGFELERVIPDAEELQPARDEVDALVDAHEVPEEIPPDLLEKILDTALEKGKFHSAARCLDLLGRRDAYVDRFVAGAGEKLRAGDVAGAARDVAVASNLSSDAGFPLFQYSGPELHANCTSSPQECLTRAPAEEAVTRALEYLLEGDRVRDFIGGLGAGEKRGLLPHVALERDPHLREFYSVFGEAHAALGEIEASDLAALKEDAGRAADAAARLAVAIQGASPGGGGAAAAVERAGRMASGFRKDFEAIDSLIDDLQLRRVRRRLGNMIESESELRSIEDAMREAGVEGGRIGDTVALMESLREKGVLEKIDDIEAKLVGLQVGLLGRAVHSQEHWQFLRELAFKYPASPIMCCIRKLNDRYMVVPRWDSELTSILRDFLGDAPPASA